VGIVVQKYGGSSVGDVAKLRAVADCIVQRHRQGDRLVVVVSAMGKTTDQLIAMAQQVSSAPPRRELDMLVTAGERMSMALLSMAIHEAGCEAISFTGSQSGIITEDSHQGARIIEVRPYRIEQELGAGRIVIVAGYQGVSLRREVTTLGRGGSDTSAVALAAALDAEACEIYSDVDGVYSADPRICPQAKHLPQLSYETMQTMSGAGAKVLNAQAVEFARKAGITIQARKTGDADARQTTVSAEEGQPPQIHQVVAVVGHKRAVCITGMVEEPAALTGAVTEAAGRPMAFGGHRPFSLLVDTVDLPNGDHRPLREVAGRFSCDLVDAAVVTLVGSGLATRKQLLAAVAKRLAQEAVTPIAWVGNETALSLAVAPDSCDAVVRGLHAELVENGADG